MLSFRPREFKRLALVIQPVEPADMCVGVGIAAGTGVRTPGRGPVPSLTTPMGQCAEGYYVRTHRWHYLWYADTGEQILSDVTVDRLAEHDRLREAEQDRVHVQLEATPGGCGTEESPDAGRRSASNVSYRVTNQIVT